MRIWPHKHIISLANFSTEDYEQLLTLADKFNSNKENRIKKIPFLEGCLVTSLFFEASTRTRNSFELAAKRLSADVQTFNSSSSSMSKGETDIDTALTYSSMGSNILIIRHSSNNGPLKIAQKIDHKKITTSIINAGDGLNGHPSQGLLDLYTLINFFSPKKINPSILNSKNILIVGDVLHSRVARSNILALSAFGANITLCGPEELVPNEMTNFINSTYLNQLTDPIKHRGKINISRSLQKSISNTDAIIILRLQKERMNQNYLDCLKSYSKYYCLTLDKLKSNKKELPVLHPGPVNRDIEISSKVVDEYKNCLINNQITNGIAIRMAMLFLTIQYQDSIQSNFNPSVKNP